MKNMQSLSIRPGGGATRVRPSVGHLSSSVPFQSTNRIGRPGKRLTSQILILASTTEVQYSQNGNASPLESPRSPLNTGTSDLATAGPGMPLLSHPLQYEKTVVFVRHGMTTWNEQKRIQGDTDISELTSLGEEQAEMTRKALSRMPFDSCFTSPIKRARRFAELTWAGREGPLIPMHTLKEAHLGWLQGMRQDEALQTLEGTRWRQSPGDFGIGGRYPVKEVFGAAAATWQDVLEAPGRQHLVVTHKSILRALICVSLGLPPTSFRAFDVNNGGICTFRVNTRGEAMLANLNQTAHLHYDGVFY
ncbi:probable phosphoglycerate mutase GpmB [Coccomyxa sp. Obi]|nr:probable phosphoglycerate mutase GpmB [Coccomyxa sp. Obi]